MMNQISPQGMPVPPRPPMPPQRRAPTSRLALAALILAVMPCCPAISLVGTVLGMAALRRIQAAKGTLGGRKLALWAIGVGISITILSTIGMTMLARTVDQTNREIITTQIFEVINASVDQQPDRAAKAWNAAKNQTPSHDRFAAFGNEAAKRYGRLERFSISSMNSGGTLFQQRMEVAGVYIFRNAERTGSAIFDVQPRTGDIWLQFRLRNLVIEDRERGDLKLPQDNSSP